MTESQRKIIHVDMDCFYAAIEARDFPELQGKPIAVGGQPDKRGVVATCSYEARAFGIHSAMAMSQAVKKCPQLIIQPVRMAVYQQESVGIKAIFKNYTDTIQPLSLDEAFLDVTGSDLCHGSATLIAQQIRQDIWQQHQLAASAGIAPNKFLAKIASDWYKPNGQYVITPDQIDDFVKDLPVKKIYGVGKVTAKKMHDMNIHTCADLQLLDQKQLQQRFGVFGKTLYNLCRGIDNRPVQTHSERKSVSVEDTFLHDLPNLTACQAEIKRLYDALKTRHEKALTKQNIVIKALYVKIKFHDFTTTTAQKIHQQLDIKVFHDLIKTAWHRKSKPVRLLGLGIQYKQAADIEQIGLNF
ncbi:DNA polymerase IV [Marinicella sp. S1101]|uniref:DNA polymerase IV n=1 Tax=Marinicella marina TaxID=2996016 RepID=UPI002260AFE3|nr:DNA polymerase IV [Marinicella marina]MCX7554231.1 DNA polymerase IV [Marinicella marina]MDJ1138776.1 DNA polymerase IV [Marinicella marina]